MLSWLQRKQLWSVLELMTSQVLQLLLLQPLHPTRCGDLWPLWPCWGRARSLRPPSQAPPRLSRLRPGRCPPSGPAASPLLLLPQSPPKWHASTMTIASPTKAAKSQAGAGMSNSNLLSLLNQSSPLQPLHKHPQLPQHGLDSLLQTLPLQPKHQFST